MVCEGSLKTTAPSPSGLISIFPQTDSELSIWAQSTPFNGRHHGVCSPLLAGSSSALSASCTLAFGDAGCAPAAARSSQSVDRCVPGTPDQIPGLCCCLGSPAMTTQFGPQSNSRAILTSSHEPGALLTAGWALVKILGLPLARGCG